MKKAQFKTNNTTEHKFIIALLYSHGYRKDFYNADEAHENLKEYPYLVIMHDGNIGGNYSERDKFTRGELFDIATTPMGEILEFLNKADKSIIIENVGEYTAEITDDGITIYDQFISFEKFAEIEDALSEVSSRENMSTKKDLQVATKNVNDLKSLIHLLYANGYEYHGKTLDEAWSRYNSFPILNIYDDNRITGNYKLNASPMVFNFPEDIDKIYNMIRDTKIESDTVEDVGNYRAIITSKDIKVGCQTISIEKFEEIAKAVKTIKH